MVRFLLNRPIAVSMTYIAILMLGLVAVFQLPVSLMPNIDIPEITIQVEGENMPVRQLENALVRPIRQQLIQVSHVESIQSETSDQTAIIKLRFEYGTDVDLAFIDVNEKIDRSMNYLPKDVKRPRVIKASASDIPVFFLNITAKESYLTNEAGTSTDLSNRFAELSRFSSQVIKKRIEQLPEIAMADISGTIEQEIVIEPYKQKLVSLGVDYSDIEQAIVEHNLELGNIIVKDGVYQYNLRFKKIIEDKSDIENILLKLEGKSIKIKEIAAVKVKPQKRNGLITSNKNDAIALAVIKKSGARMQDMKKSLKELVDNFKHDYPDVGFEIIRDQSRILDYSINNLGQTLLLGSLLAFVVMFLFLRDTQTPFLIGLSIPTSLIISVLFFYFLDISINIISLSGLVLGVGMMIDNSIIVIDNITQNIDRGESLQSACIKGTNEVIRPLLTSVFTTCAVFIPLIFISGIAGALFFDQAMAVTIGLFVSFIVSITLVPVYYKLLSKKRNASKITLLSKIKLFDYFNVYEKILFYVFRHQRPIVIALMLFIILGGYFYKILDKEKLPVISEDELFISIDWNEKIHIEENKLRSLELLNNIDSLLVQSSTYVGTQDFVMQHDNLSSPRETKIYLKLKDQKYLPVVTEKIKRFFKRKYAEANYEILPPENVFELLFPNEQYSLIAQIVPFEKNKELVFSEVNELLQHFPDGLNAVESYSIPSKEYVNIVLNSEKLMIYDVERMSLIRKLKSLFNELQISEIRSSQNYMPIIFGNKKETLSKLLNDAKIRNSQGNYIPIKELISLKTTKDFKNIIAGELGEYYQIYFNPDETNIDNVKNKVESIVEKNKTFDVLWHGSYFSNKKMISEILIILIISVLLLYFILASQFESLSIPLIVLLEIPIDIAAIFISLFLFQSSINMMSLIGIILTIGIIINDSILKIDTINSLCRNGVPLIKAIVVGGKRRLKPILMTSLTTIMAMVPFLFISGLGSDLQKPLAISVIGGMLMGTLVSLFFIPLLYYLLKKKKSIKMETSK